MGPVALRLSIFMIEAVDEVGAEPDARLRRKSSITSRRHMPMYSLSLSVWPTSTSRLDGEIIFILVTRRSMISMGRSNSSTMQRGMAPPQGLQLSILRSIRYVSTPPLASVSAAQAPDGPPPITATRSGRSSTVPSATADTDTVSERCWDCGCDLALARSGAARLAFEDRRAALVFCRSEPSRR